MNTIPPPQKSGASITRPLRGRSLSKLFLLAAAAVLCIQELSAAQFTNGDLTGPTNTFSLVPPGWSNLPQGTTDTVSTAGHPFSSIGGSGLGNWPYAASPNGGTFAWSSDFFQANTAQPEGLSQTVTGFSVGTVYVVRFEFTNLALYDTNGNIATNAFGVGQNYDSSGRWLVMANGSLIGATPLVAPVPMPGTQVWSVFSQTFVATSSSITFAFAADWVSGPGTHVGMGIDGIAVVPEPATPILFLAGVVGIALLGSKRVRRFYVPRT